MKAQLTTSPVEILHILLICTASDFGILVIVNRLVNLQVWAEAKLRKKYSQVP